MDSANMLDYNYLFNNKGDTIINGLYENIQKAEKSLNKNKKSKYFNYIITKINNSIQIPKPTIYNIPFFPDKIKTYIDEHAKYSLQFTCTIYKRVIIVYFIIFDYTTQELLFTLNQYIQMVYIWISMIHMFSRKKCSKRLELYVYFTPFKKKLPDNQLIILNSEHVNTGYTSGCREETEIVIYRKEEWFKVFIHETFHNFGLDFSDMNLTSINKDIREIFNVNVEYNLYESYCEVWARMLNTLIYSYLILPSQHKPHFEIFKTTFKENMRMEAYHSLYQALKILTFMNLSFKVITHKSSDKIELCNHLYRENTSIFSYYIITSLLMNNYIDFLEWCSQNNNNKLLQFEKTTDNLTNYVDFIRTSCENPHIKKNINKLEKNIKKTNNISKNLKMTIIEFKDVM
jgi:hypothetical protein